MLLLDLHTDSQEAGQVAWYSHLLKNFWTVVLEKTLQSPSDCKEIQPVHPKRNQSWIFILWYCQKSRSRCFLEFLCFFYDPTNVGKLISDSSAFSKSRLYFWKVLVHVLLKSSLKDFEHYLASEMSAIVWQFEHSLALPFFEIGMKSDLFQSFGHCRVSQVCGILSTAL